VQGTILGMPLTPRNYKGSWAGHHHFSSKRVLQEPLNGIYPTRNGWMISYREAISSTITNSIRIV